MTSRPGGCVRDRCALRAARRPGRDIAAWGLGRGHDPWRTAERGSPPGSTGRVRGEVPAGQHGADDGDDRRARPPAEIGSAERARRMSRRILNRMRSEQRIEYIQQAQRGSGMKVPVRGRLAGLRAQCRQHLHCLPRLHPRIWRWRILASGMRHRGVPHLLAGPSPGRCLPGRPPSLRGLRRAGHCPGMLRTRSCAAARERPEADRRCCGYGRAVDVVRFFIRTTPSGRNRGFPPWQSGQHLVTPCAGKM